ncbi:MAG TPA: hypothetical protein VFL15_11265 [Gammaproteobacteria bacterium]|nr:hypothetical protein [Gammaproteobacteria bacterium]
MSAHPFLAGLANNPDYLLQNLDLVNRRGLVIRITRADYRQAAFLDDRMFRPSMQGAWFALDDLLQATATVPARKANYLFHIGHCGSTLLSRLLGELPNCLALREPLPFLALGMTRRDLTAPARLLDSVQWQALFDSVIRLQARCYADTDTALVKSTSAASNLLQPALDAHAESRAVLLYLNLETWLATMLRAETNRESVRAYAPAWLGDFRHLTGDDSLRLPALSDVQQAVLSWATMLLNFTSAAHRNPARTCWIDFDEFLRQPAEQYRLLTEFLGLTTAAEAPGSPLDSPIMEHYAKDPHQRFNAAQRAQELGEARRHLAAELNAGLAWFEELARRVPALLNLGPPAQRA